jgi:deazaflavin-dependent oxidoreductase (nitroreductase family)
MKMPSAQIIERMRQFFKALNVFMLWMWRLGLRKWMNICPPVIGRILVITHIGRKTGLPRHTPLNYTIVEGELYCMAGFGKISDWYRNMMWAGVAEEVTGGDNTLPIIRQLVKDSGVAGLMFGLNAYTMSDEHLAAATKSYRLMRIRRTERLRGRGGPGDLAWLWLIPAAILLAKYLL